MNENTKTAKLSPAMAAALPTIAKGRGCDVALGTRMALVRRGLALQGGLLLTADGAALVDAERDRRIHEAREVERVAAEIASRRGLSPDQLAYLAASKSKRADNAANVVKLAPGQSLETLATEMGLELAADETGPDHALQDRFVNRHADCCPTPALAVAHDHERAMEDNAHIDDDRAAERAADRAYVARVEAQNVALGRRPNGFDPAMADHAGRAGQGRGLGRGAAVTAPLADPAGPVVVDLCCKAGGMSAGLALAGFRPVGIDVEPQPRYPYEFIEADVTRIDLAQACRVLGAVAVVGSPPCKVHTSLAGPARATAARWDHVDLIPAVRAAMRATGLPYVIENVEGARRHLVDPVTLCGTEFDLKTVDQDGRTRWLRRHRLFESNVALVRRSRCDGCSGRRPDRPVGGVYGRGGGAPRTAVSRGGRRRGGYQLGADQGRAILGTPWMLRHETAEAIPPAYGEWIGRQLMTHLKGETWTT